MSLISQNIPLKNRNNNKNKRDDDDDNTDKPAIVKENEDIDDKKESDLDVVVKIKKRKKDRVEDAKQVEVEQKEMMKLENTLFGSLYSPVEFGKENVEEEEEGEEGSALFFTDRSANSVLSVYEEEDGEEGSDGGEEESKEKKAIWVDEEVEQMSKDIGKVNRLRKLRKDEDESLISGKVYESRLRAQHIKMSKGAGWAQDDSWARSYNYDDDDDDDDELDEENGVAVAHRYNKDIKAADDIIRTTGDLVVKSTEKLLPGLLEHSRLVDANAEDPSNGPINSVQFHRNGQLLLAAGLDRRLRFFQIDGKRNTKIQSIYLDDCPIRKASFLPDGSQVIIAGRRKFFYSFDLVKATVDKIGPLTGREEKSLEVFEVSPDSRTIAFVGNEGYILLVSTKTKELIGTLKMNGTVRSVAFADDGRHLLSTGGDGHVYHWDLRTRSCFHKAVDEGCINGTALCTSPSGNLFAAGSGSGIVNVYNREEFLGGKRKPIKTIENLTTKVDFMKFNHDAQILAICSSMKKSSFKLVHVPSYTVFSNWPSPNSTLHYPRCLDFSPGGGFMAFGNAAGKVLLYKLHHYLHA